MALTVFIAVILTTITTYILYLVRKCRKEEKKKKKDESESDSEGEEEEEEQKEREVELFGEIGEGLDIGEEEEGEISWTKVVDDLEQKKKVKMDHILHETNKKKEFLETEERYVVDLRALVDYFVKPMKAEEMVSKNAILKPNLSKLEMILGINEVFLSDLKKVISPTDSNIEKLEEFSETVYKFSQTFKLYSDFTSRYDVFDRELSKMKKKKKKFRKLIEDIEAKMRNDKLRMCQLSSYLITPIQRIPRYELMLRDMLKIVTSDFKEYYELIKAYRIIKEMAIYCNNKSKELGNIRRVKEIQDKCNLKNIVQPHRHLIREGVIDRIRNSGKPLKSHIHLFTDLLVVYPVHRPMGMTYFKEPYVVELTSPKCKIKIKEGEKDRKTGEELYLVVISYENEYAYSKRASIGGASNVKIDSPSHMDKGLRLSFATKEELEGWFVAIMNQARSRRASRDFV